MDLNPCVTESRAYPEHVTHAAYSTLPRAFTGGLLPVRGSLSLFLACSLVLEGKKELSSLMEVLGAGREWRA